MGRSMTMRYYIQEIERLKKLGPKYQWDVQDAERKLRALNKESDKELEFCKQLKQDIIDCKIKKEDYDQLYLEYRERTN